MRSFRRLRVRAGRKGSTFPISGWGQRRERRAANGGTTKRRIRAGGQPIKPACTARSTAAKAAGAHARTGNDGAKWHPRNRTGNTKPPTRGGATAPHKAAAGGKRKHRTGNTHLPKRGVPAATATTSDRGRTSGAAPSVISDFCRANHLWHYLI